MKYYLFQLNTYLTSFSNSDTELATYSWFSTTGNSFQNLKVSSPAPVTTVSLSGDKSIYNTLLLCPLSSATGCIQGYFHMLIRFSEYPWLETSSWVLIENFKLQTWEFVLMHIVCSDEWMFHSLIVLSAVPPPDAIMFELWGHQSKAFTAALWPESIVTGFVFNELQSMILLSLPPETK